MFRIGHASSDGYPRDNQVKIGPWYTGGWKLLLRPKNLAVAAKSAAICEAVCNNNYVMYSQGRRNTLKEKALLYAKLDDDLDGSQLSKVMPADIAKITVDCWADCASLMTFCAVCGGAKVSYNANGSGNAAVCSGLRPLLTKNGAADADYVAITDSRFLTSTSYLQRGDILVSSGHTVMALDCGDKAPELDYSSFVFGEGAAVANTGLVDITSLKINPTITDITKTSIKVKLVINKFQDGVEKSLESKDELKDYAWKYCLEPLDGAKSEIQTDNLKVTAATLTKTFSKLKPDKTYLFHVSAVKAENNVNLKSAICIFTTLRDLPTPVKNLSVVFDNTETLNKKCKISFNAPDSWGTSSLNPCYRVFLFVNGNKVAYNDTLLSATGSKKTDMLEINKLTSGKILFKYNDTIQLGVLPGLKSSKQGFLFDNNALVCSVPFLVENSMKPVDKIYTKVKDTYKRTVIYNNTERQ